MFLNMKKMLFGLFAAAALTLSLSSCGEALLTDEQVQAEIQKGFEAGKAAVESDENAKCDADFEKRVQEKVAAMDAEAQAAQPAEATK